MIHILGADLFYPLHIPHDEAVIPIEGVKGPLIRL